MNSRLKNYLRRFLRNLNDVGDRRLPEHKRIAQKIRNSLCRKFRELGGIFLHPKHERFPKIVFLIQQHAVQGPPSAQGINSHRSNMPSIGAFKTLSLSQEIKSSFP